jgi:hypothetical protein
MTDRELAQNLLDAEKRGDMDDIVEYENEILFRLDWPDDCGQGLTPEAAAEITAFCTQHGVEE